jgi:hypothetical protein
MELPFQCPGCDRRLQPGEPFELGQELLQGRRGLEGDNDERPTVGLMYRFHVGHFAQRIGDRSFRRRQSLVESAPCL